MLRYRPDVDGLRAVAVLGVLLFHAGVWQVSGGFAGVDIFFVISGYLITSLLFMELDRTGRIDFVNFWARRTRRILPSALLVIVATIAATYLVASDLRTLYAAQDAIYAALYVINWHQLAANLDYFNDEGGKGLFLHYWSLAVEEQFYLFLTLVFVVALSAWRSKNAPWTAGQLASALLVGLAALSFIGNLILTAEAEPVAFFGTHTRIWQLCVGSIVALLERRGWTPASQVRSLMAWIGSGAILLAFLIYDAKEIAYPGIYAALPTVGAALFLLAGINAGSALPPLPLRVASMVIPIAIGKLSYALYLWHWPVFELYQSCLGSWKPMDRVIALGVTVALSIASHFTVENPIRFGRTFAARPLRSLGASAAVTLLVVAWAGRLQVEAAGRYIVLTSGAVVDLQYVTRDIPRVYADNCHVDYQEVGYPPCIYGRRDSAQRLFLVGDSHAAQWFPALNWVAQKYGLALYVRTKSDCPFTTISVFEEKFKRVYYECEKWRASVLEEMEELRPAIVVIGTSSHSKPVSPRTGKLIKKKKDKLTALAEGERKLIARIAENRSSLVMIADTPRFPKNPLNCLFDKARPTSLCRWSMQDSLPSARFPWSFRHNKPPPGVSIIDLSDQLCWDGFCYAANDRAIIMRDRTHITASFSESLGPEFGRRLESILRIPYAAQLP